MTVFFKILFAYIFLLYYKNLSMEENFSNEHLTTQKTENKNDTKFDIANVNFSGIRVPLTLSLWILIVSFSKFFFTKVKFLEEWVPESCMLILLGIIVRLLLLFPFKKYDILESDLTLSSELFFLVLLPPIILEAGYSMPGRPFFDNIGLILLLAFVGTIFNTLAIGFSLYGVSVIGWFGVEINSMQCLLFASLISAVDPVAILAVFDEIDVNDVLNIVVFGESLLNDGVSIVLYNMFRAFNKIGSESLKGINMGAGVISFFAVAGGGTLVGVLFAIMIIFITKFTYVAPLLEPIIVLTMAYLSYIFADMFELSGILAAIFCGFIMSRYVEKNLTTSSNETLTYILKLAAGLSQSIIFLLFGMSTIHRNHVANWVFIISSLLFCLIYRVIASFVLIKIANRKKLNKLSNLDIFIVVYSGFRGAIAFSLCTLISEKEVGKYTKNMFETTTVFIILFTSIFQGISIKPLVNALNIEMQDKKIPPTIVGKLFTDMIDHVSNFIGDLVGKKGMKQLRLKFNKFDSKFIKPYLLKGKGSNKNLELAEQLEKLNAAELNEYLYKEGWDLSSIIQNVKRKISFVSADKMICESKDENIHENFDYILLNQRRKTKKYSRLSLNGLDKSASYSHEVTPNFSENKSDYRRKTVGAIARHSPLTDLESAIKKDKYSSRAEDLKRKSFPTTEKSNWVFKLHERNDMNNITTIKEEEDKNNHSSEKPAIYKDFSNSRF